MTIQQNYFKTSIKFWQQEGTPNGNHMHLVQ
jgi:hypothetical protein